MDSGSSSSGSSSASQSTGTDRLAGKQLRLVLEDEFNGDSLDKSKWNQEVTLWGGGVSIAIFFCKYHRTRITVVRPHLCFIPRFLGYFINCF